MFCNIRLVILNSLWIHPKEYYWFFFVIDTSYKLIAIIWGITFALIIRFVILILLIIKQFMLVLSFFQEIVLCFITEFFFYITKH